jgi:CheY-like chemotaxis protein
MLEIMARERPDLVLMDVMMPGVDGRDAYRQLRSRPENRDVPVVMMSAAVQSHRLDPSIAGFMAKPFDLTHLIELVVRLIGHPNSSNAT